MSLRRRLVVTRKQWTQVLCESLRTDKGCDRQFGTSHPRLASAQTAEHNGTHRRNNAPGHVVVIRPLVTRDSGRKADQSGFRSGRHVAGAGPCGLLRVPFSPLIGRGRVILGRFFSLLTSSSPASGPTLQQPSNDRALLHTGALAIGPHFPYLILAHQILSFSTLSVASVTSSVQL